MPKRKTDEINIQKQNPSESGKKKKPRRRRVIWSDSDSEKNSSIATPSSDVESPIDGNTSLQSAVLAPELTLLPHTNPPHEPALDATQTAVTNSSTKEKEPIQPKLHPNILVALGAKTADGPLHGDKINKKLSQLWTPLLKNGFSKEDREKLIKEHPIPRNCTLLQAPKLNLEILAAITESAQNRDKSLMSAQQQLGVGITAMNRALDMLLTSDVSKLKVIKNLSDACRILCDLHHTETQARINLVTPSLDKNIINVVQGSNRDETLFGNKLSEKIKCSKTITKQGLQIKKSKVLTNPAPSTSTPRPPRPRGTWTANPRYATPKEVLGRNKKEKVPDQAPVVTQTKQD